MSSPRTVWGIGTSRTVRPQWALIELGLDYEHKKILPRGGGIENSGLLAVSPRHKVPFYEDDRVKIGESAGICCYLANRHGGDQGLRMPEHGSAELADFYDHVFYIMTEIDARLYTVRMHAQPPLGLSETYGEAPVACDAAKNYVQRGFTEAERWLSDGRSFVMGDEFGVPDILLVTCLDWALGYDMKVSDALQSYRGRVAARPSYDEAMKRNDASNAET